MEEENPFAWAPNWSSSIGFGVDLKNESGVDALGLRKEWLSLCLQSIVMPEAPEGHEKAGFECIKSGSCGADAGTQYLLEALPTGELIPIRWESRRGRGQHARCSPHAFQVLGQVAGSSLHYWVCLKMLG